MNIRGYTLEDKEGIERCIFELQTEEHRRLPEYWADPNVALKSYFDFLVKRLKSHSGTIFVAEEGDQIIGCVSVLIEAEESPCVAAKKFAYIPDVVVLKDYQGKGTGEALLKRAEQFGKEAGVGYLYLDVTISNPAVNFYRKAGYVDQGLRMEKKLE